jgi:NAD(P)-dependent dehydrogenase (short-subunit alcohol dehydrogenase family)
MLKNKKILFFGTNNEISIAIVESLFEQNADVVFVSQNEITDVDVLDKFPNNYIVKDYYSTEKIEDIFKTEFINEKGFDGVVFGGGIGGVRPIKLNKIDFVKTMFDANVFSFMELMRHIVKRDFLNDGASIVGLSSVSSVKGLKSKEVYSASKAALEAAIRACAAELSDRKIRVNSIQKGWITSDMNLDFIKDNRTLNDDSDLKKQLLGPIEPNELANLVVFLLSDQVKTITGTSIVLDGGYSL